MNFQIEPNFQHLWDTSVACWATDYFMAVCAIFSIYKIFQYRQKLPAMIAKKEKNLQVSLTQYKVVLDMNSLCLAFLAIVGISAGIKHQFLSFDGMNETFIANLMWFLSAVGLIGLFSTFLINTYMTIIKISRENFKYLVMFIGATIVSIIGFLLLNADNYLGSTISMVSLLATGMMMFRFCFNKCNFLAIKKRLFFGPAIAQIAFGFTFDILRSGCSIPFAWSSGCPFPDWFNHNAVLHLIWGLAQCCYCLSYIYV